MFPALLKSFINTDSDYQNNKPGKRMYHSMVYDHNSNRVLLFGGQSFHSWKADLQDIWAYNVGSESWTKIGNHKKERYGLTTQIRTHGSKCSRNSLRAGAQDIEWSTWERIKQSSPPSPRAKHTMVYSRRQNKLIVFGGCVTKIYDDKYITDQLWIFDPKNALWLNSSL